MIAMDMVMDIGQTVNDVCGHINETAQTVLYKKPLGTYHITAYAWTGNPCANGEYPVVGRTVACNSLLLGTRIYIEDLGEYTIEDRGASWHSDRWMDLYLGDVETCIEWGNQEREVYILYE